MSSRNRVIVRAYGDEPTPLWVSKVVAGRVIVTNTEESSTLSLPWRSVYEFDGALLKDLSSAFYDGDTDRLRSLWAKATLYVTETVLQ